LRKKLPLYGLILLVLIGAYFSLDWVMGAIIHSRKVVVVPDLMGKSISEAVSLVSPLGLGVVKEGEQFDKSFPAGIILRQSPLKGMKVRTGRFIKLTVSQGGETLFVPDIIGQPLRNAQTLLQNSGLNMGEIEHKPSLRFEEDVVMTTDPGPKSVVSKGALVSVTVSEGPPSSNELLTPDFSSKLLPEAKRWADAHQVNLTVREENDLSKAPGEVLEQLPTPDTPIHGGETLTVVVNSGDMSQTPAGTKRIFYQVPAGTNDRDVRILIIDEKGEHEVYRKANAPETRLNLMVQPQGRARARIFLNGIMAEEQDLQ
jgi:beta-lactam-binding protein with PASTA domain